MGHHLAGRHGVGVGDDDGAVGRGAAAVRVAGGGQQVERQQHVDTRHAGVVRRHRRVVGDADVARHRSGLLRQPCLVEAAHGVAGQHRRGSEDLADGDDTRPTDPGQPHREPGRVDDRRRLREVADVDGARRRAGQLLARRGRSTPWRTPGSRPPCTRSRSCSSSGRCGSCDRTACRPAAPTGSCSWRRSRHSPRRPVR